jgi:cobalt-zinc-cadmium efflux system outer membrane protein
MFKKITTSFYTALFLNLFCIYSFATTLHNELSFADILGMVREDNIEIQLRDLQVDEQKGQLRQESLWWNPDFTMTFENFDNDRLEKTFMVSQEIEYVGKRYLKKQNAKIDVKLANNSFSEKEREVLAESSDLYAEIIVAQKRVALAQKRVVVFKGMIEASQKRVLAGKSSKIEQIRIQSFLAYHKINVLQTIQELRNKQRELEALWNHQHIHFKKVIGDLEQLPVLKTQESLEKLFVKNPNYQKYLMQMDQYKNRLSYAQRQWWPNLSLDLGVRDFNETDERAYLAGISFSLPIFDRNQGGIQSAKAAYKSQQLLMNYMKTQMDVSFHEQYESLSVLDQKIDILKKEVLPLSQESLALAEKAYAQGRFSYLELMAIEKNYFDRQEEFWKESLEYIQKYNALQIFLGQTPHLYASV